MAISRHVTVFLKFRLRSSPNGMKITKFEAVSLSPACSRSAKGIRLMLRVWCSARIVGTSYESLNRVSHTRVIRYRVSRTRDSLVTGLRVVVDGLDELSGWGRTVEPSPGWTWRVIVASWDRPWVRCTWRDSRDRRH